MATPFSDSVVDWPIPRLLDHIVGNHHAFVRSALPAIATQLARLEIGDGARHPELKKIEDVFGRLSHELEMHLLKEEQILFPYIRELAEAGNAPTTSPFGSVANPIRMMEHEHLEADEALREIRTLTDDYRAPADAGAAYAECMQALEQFEVDLHRHIQLENEILFPRAVALESGVTTS